MSQPPVATAPGPWADHPTSFASITAPPFPVTPQTALVARALGHRYAGTDGQPAALAGVDLIIGAGESVSIMGPSGSGKTTLLHLLAGILTPSAGGVHWRGHDLAAMSEAERTRLRRRDFGFVFQSGQLLPELPAEENAALGLMLDGLRRRAAVERVRPILQRLGLGELGHRRPGELSGGQAQRVAIARAVAGEPGVIFADEPTGALDTATGAEVMGTLTAAARSHGASLVVITHDLDVARHCDRILTLRDGHVVGDHRRGVAA